MNRYEPSHQSDSASRRRGPDLRTGAHVAARRHDHRSARRVSRPRRKREPSLRQQPQADIDKKSAGCLTCHTPDTKSMHRDNLARAGCTDCHGGDAGPMRDKSLAKGSPQFEQIQKQAHVQPTLDIWKDSAANPPEVWYQTIRKRAEFIRFVNPGDLRDRPHQLRHSATRKKSATSQEHDDARRACSGARRCTTTASFPLKNAPFGESYSMNGTPACGSRRSRRRPRSDDQARRASCRSSTRCPRSRSRSRATSSASSSAAARKPARDRHPRP